jgi:hypothetical protein
LAACPKAVEKSCPKRWGREDFESYETFPRTEEELIEALKAVAQEPVKTFVGTGQQRLQVTMRCVAFLDGLDEHDGDHRTLVDLLLALANSDRVKICASSRPWNFFRDAFEEPRRMICLEEHTGADIAHYVRSELGKSERANRRSRILCKDTATETIALQEAIISKFNGVFFWVFLVVRSLGHGFANGDSLALMRRVNLLPSELNKYFTHMLTRLEKPYQTLTAQVLFFATLLHQPR